MTNIFPCRKLNQKETIALVLTAETKFVALTMAMLACLLRNSGILVYALFWSGVLRDCVVTDRRPELQTPGYCLVFGAAAVFAVSPVFYVSCWIPVISVFAMCVYSLLRWIAISHDAIPFLLHRFRPVDQDNAIRVSSGVLLTTLRHCAVDLVYALLSWYIGGSIWLVCVLFALAIGFLAFSCYYWSRAAVLDGSSLHILGPRKGKYDLCDLRIIPSKSKFSGSVVFRDSDGNSVFRMNILFQNAVCTESVLRKKKWIS